MSGEVNLCGCTKCRSDTSSSAPHAILDLLHGVVAECPELTADDSRLGNHVGNTLYNKRHSLNGHQAPASILGLVE
jgi:hypothetical protein